MRQKKGGESFCVSCNASSDVILRELKTANSSSSDTINDDLPDLELEDLEENLENFDCPLIVSEPISIPRKTTKADVGQNKEKQALTSTSTSVAGCERFLWEEIARTKDQLKKPLPIEKKIQLVRYLKECASCLSAFHSLKNSHLQ
jgi:hypothetical protein